MLEVHHLNNSRSQRVLWLLEELGIEYQVIAYRRDAKTMLAPAELKAIHPLGKSPVIRDGGAVLAESGAIIEYLVERYGRQFGPSSEGQSLQKYRYFMHYAEGTFMSPLLIKLYLGRVGEAAKPLIERMDAQIQMHLDFIESELTQPFLVGKDLSAADIQLSFPVELTATQGALSDKHPRVREWLRRLHQRPAYVRAIAKGGPYAYTKD